MLGSCMTTHRTHPVSPSMRSYRSRGRGSGLGGHCAAADDENTEPVNRRCHGRPQGGRSGRRAERRSTRRYLSTARTRRRIFVLHAMRQRCGGRRQNKPVWLPVHGHNGVAVSVTLIRVAVSACASRLHPSAWQAPRHCLLPNLSCPSSARARVFCMPVYLAFRRRSPLGPPSRSRRGMCSASTARCCTTVTARFASATTAHPMRQCESADQRPQGCTASAPSARSTALTQWAKET